MKTRKYHKTYKAKLEKVSKLNRKDIFEPTLEDCQEWFRIINQEIFKNRLPRIKNEDWEIARRRNQWAYYVYRDGKNFCTRMWINNKYNSKKDFINILGHEMVHHYQNVFGKPLGHGPSFNYWKPVFARKGLVLTLKY